MKSTALKHAGTQHRILHNVQ